MARTSLLGYPGAVWAKTPLARTGAGGGGGGGKLGMTTAGAAEVSSIPKPPTRYGWLFGQVRVPLPPTVVLVVITSNPLAPAVNGPAGPCGPAGPAGPCGPCVSWGPCAP